VELLSARRKIMDSKEIVQALMDSIQKGHFEKAKTYLADDFQFNGIFPEPINAETWLGMSFSLKLAFAHLDYRFMVVSAEGDIVNATMQLSGINRGAFDLTSINRGVISATQKNFSTATQNNKITVRDEKVSSWVVEPTEGAGLKEILNQLGVKLPKIQNNV